MSAVAGIARPFRSLRHELPKRPLEPEDDFELAQPTKCACVSDRIRRPLALDMNQSSTALANLAAPVARELSSAADEWSGDTSLSLEDHFEESMELAGSGLGDEAVNAALQLFSDLEERFLTNQFTIGDEKACELGEIQAGEGYDAARAAVMALLPFTGHSDEPQQSVGRVSYDAIEFRGCGQSARGDRERFSSDASASEIKLHNARQSGLEARAREALCAVLSIMASRKEKVWLEAYDLGELVDSKMDELSGRPNKKHVFRQVLAKVAASNVRSYFARALVEPTSFFRLSFTRGESQPRPASLMVTYELPFKKVLQKMDGGGPLQWKPEGFRDASWKAGREFAFQDIIIGEASKGSKTRQDARTLKPDPALAKWLRSKTPVLYLDSIAALAPRGLARKHGISEIVKAELARLLSEAKARGQPVIFLVGSDDEQALAGKVYLRPPLTDHGLRCGWLRWRDSAKEPWARETVWEDRLCLGIQMP